MVVVFGDKVGEVYDAHLLAQTWVERRGGDLRLVHGFEAADKAQTRGAEGREQVFKARFVVARLLGLAVVMSPVRSVERWRA